MTGRHAILVCVVASAGCGYEPDLGPDDERDCSTFGDSEMCDASSACQWLVPGCEPVVGSVVLSEAGCYPVHRCSGNAECYAGTECVTVWNDPCWDAVCDACGGEESLCLPADPSCELRCSFGLETNDRGVALCECADHVDCDLQHPCPDGDECVDDLCVPAACSPQSPRGLCPTCEVCVDATCVAVADCGQGHICAPDNPVGLCPAGHYCVEGICARVCTDAVICGSDGQFYNDSCDFEDNAPPGTTEMDYGFCEQATCNELGQMIADEQLTVGQCSTDSECQAIYNYICVEADSGFNSGCHLFVNSTANLDRLSVLENQYRDLLCGFYDICDCPPPPEAVCVAGQCEAAQPAPSCDAIDPGVCLACEGYALRQDTGLCGCVCGSSAPLFDALESCQATCEPPVCPPCVPPPDPSCVGTGPCGCGPYECPCNDIEADILQFLDANTSCQVDADCIVAETSFEPVLVECCSAYLSATADTTTWSYLNQVWAGACGGVDACCDGGAMAQPACINGICGPGGQPELLCEATGGVWDMNTCGHYWCGQPSDLLCVDPGCDCGDTRNFVDGAGCQDDTACTGFGSGEICLSASQCDSGFCWNATSDSLCWYDSSYCTVECQNHAQCRAAIAPDPGEGALCTATGLCAFDLPIGMVCW